MVSNVADALGHKQRSAVSSEEAPETEQLIVSPVDIELPPQDKPQSAVSSDQTTIKALGHKQRSAVSSEEAPETEQLIVSPVDIELPPQDKPQSAVSSDQTTIKAPGHKQRSAVSSEEAPETEQLIVSPVDIELPPQDKPQSAVSSDQTTIKAPGHKQRSAVSSEEAPETEQLIVSPVDIELPPQDKPQSAVSSDQTTIKAPGHKQRSAVSSEEEWNQLKSFKVKITLDQEGNPEFFKILVNDTRLHCNNPKQSDDNRDDDDKFFSLCKQKFSSEKQYWEVKISEKPKEKLSWYIGVASDTAERNYKTPLIPENGFWVLCYEEENVYFKDHPLPVLLTDINETLTTVGVFLDCDEHTLSFYNVDAQSHIYTITNVKAKTLCPLISPGLRDKLPVNITKF
ncbi:uncharacterized protein LOC143510675 [Brachyhypopomus gauderio]|uniref:uncharacterized protein LOC143510675 n=1 Tax=Brachyhypopomus gauderio TaxID=698409 RepID=UPI004040EA98